VSAIVLALTAAGSSEVIVALAVFIILLIRERLALQRRPPQHRTIHLRKGLSPPELQPKN
jgi:hypothetical protein